MGASYGCQPVVCTLCSEPLPAAEQVAHLDAHGPDSPATCAACVAWRKLHQPEAADLLDPEWVGRTVTLASEGSLVTLLVIGATQRSHEVYVNGVELPQDMVTTRRTYFREPVLDWHA